MTTLAWYRAEIARHEQHAEQWRATAAELQRENTELRRQMDALVHAHALEIAEMKLFKAYERLAYRADV